MSLPKKITFIWLFFFIFSFSSLYFFKDQTFEIESDYLGLEPGNEYGVYNFKKHSIPSNGWITGVEFEISGAPKDRVHHAILVNNSRRDRACPNFFPDRLHATAKEFTPLYLPAGYGYYMKQKEQLGTYIHLFNTSKEEYKNIKIKAKIHFQPESLIRRLKFAHPIWVDVKKCEWDTSVFIPAKKTETLTLTYPDTVPTNARLIYAWGHLHNYGKSLKLKVGDVEINYIPESEDGVIKKINFFSDIDNQNFKVYGGQKIEIEGLYENPLDKEIDAMASSIIYLNYQ